MPKKSEIKSPFEALSKLAAGLKTQATRPNIHAYKPHAKQIIFHTEYDKGNLYIGGNRSGKTTGGIAEDIFQLTGKNPYRAVKPPPVAGRIISTNFIDGIEKVIKPELARWLPISELRGGSWFSAYDNKLRTLYLENGSFVEFMSYDQDLDAFAGTGRDFIHFDEEPPQDIFVENKARLIDFGGSYHITMTPIEGMTWVYDDIYIPGKNGLMGIKVVEVDMTENPYLHQGEVDQFISGLDADDKAARIHGKFVQIGGLIYKMFDPEIHVIDPFIPPVDWEQYASLDHGFSNPTAWLWESVSPDGRIVVFDEHYLSGEVVSYHAGIVHVKNANHKRSPDTYIGDPSIRNVDPITGTSIQQEYGDHDIPILLGNNDVQAGINRVASYLKHPGEGDKPQLLITRNCQNLIYEMQRYRFKTYASRKMRQDNNQREVAHKKDDHACDSLRYFIMSRPDLSPLTTTMPSAPNPLGLHTATQPWDKIAEAASVVKQETDWNVETATDEILGGIW